MAYKTILVHIDAGKRWRERLQAALALAQEHDAHVVGLYALSPVQVPAFVLSAAGGEKVLEVTRQVAREHADRTEREFRAAIAGSGAKVEWRKTGLPAADAMVLHARYADLVVLGQPSADDDTGVQGGFTERVLLESGRPVFMLPYAGKFATVGKRVLVGWNARSEATRAVSDAIPFLRRAEQVHVFLVRPDGDDHGELPGSAIGAYLARHGVNVEIHVDRAREIDVGNELLSRASDIGADLLVMGAYGHSRIAEMIMGGASRTIIDSMTLPVLMSH